MPFTFRHSRFIHVFANAFLIGGIFISSLSLANDENLPRKIFLKAENQVTNANSATYQNLYNQLHYYPLQPYLDQKRLMTKMKMSSADEIDKFLHKYKGTPLDWPLRKRWLNYLAKRKKSLLFQKFYKTTSDVKLTCQYYRYQLKSGVLAATILPKVTKLWLVGKSQPKVCDPLFKQWQEAGYRTKEVIWQRIALAADGGQHSMIPYLTKLLPENERYLAILWHKVRRDPAYIKHLYKFNNKSDKSASIVTYGLKRLIWRSPKQALNIYDIAKKTIPFTEKQQQSITQKFALALASKNHDKAYIWLDKVDDTQFNSKLVQWVITDALRDQNWPDIKAKLLSLPKKSQTSAQWRYWYSRSLLETSEIEAGNSLMSELATTRHYYGFLAASFLKKPVNFQNEPLIITKAEKDLVIKSSAAKRAFEFFALGRFHQARKEWNYWLSKLNNRDKLVAAKMANEIQWYDRAIFTLAKVGYLNDVDLRFPLGFEKEITRAAKREKINPAWAFAIIRRESSFMSDANSPVGAKGLMQIMPATAKQLAQKRVTKKKLLNATYNIKLGTQYLQQLLKQFNGNQVLATASYNAGPHRVKQWLKNGKALPADIWIETIPYTETREYVKSVLAYQQIYQQKTGLTKALFDQIIAMEID